MSENIRQELRGLVSQLGWRVYASPLQCRNLLLQACPDCEFEIFSLIALLRKRVPEKLRQLPSGFPVSHHLDSYTAAVDRQIPMRQAMIRWAIETWAYALGVIDESALGPDLRALQKPTTTGKLLPLTGNYEDIPRQALFKIFDEQGISLLDDPRRCHGMLRDECGDKQREIFSLMAILELAVPQTLYSSEIKLAPEALLYKYVNEVYEKLPLRKSAIHWAIESWAMALGLIARSDAKQAVPLLPAVERTPETGGRVYAETAPALPAPLVLILTRSGYLKFRFIELNQVLTHEKIFPAGRTVAEDVIEYYFSVELNDVVVMFMENGRIYNFRVSQMLSPEAIYRPIEPEDIIVGGGIIRLIDILAFSTRAPDTRWVLIVTRDGAIKKLPARQVCDPSISDLSVIRLQGKDQVAFVRACESDDEVLLVSNAGQAKRIPVADLPPSRPEDAAIAALAFEPGEALAGAGIISAQKPANWLLTVTERGYCKKTLLTEFPISSLDGPVVYAMGDYFSRTGQIAAAFPVGQEANALLATTSYGITARLPLRGVEVRKRPAQGVQSIHLSDADRIEHVVLTTVDEAYDEDTFYMRLY